VPPRSGWSLRRNRAPAREEFSLVRARSKDEELRTCTVPLSAAEDARLAANDNE